MNHTASIPGNMDVDPLSSYEYPVYDHYSAQAYPYPNKLQSMYQTYHQNLYANNGHMQVPEPVINPPPPPPPQQHIEVVIPPKIEEKALKPVLKRSRKDRNGQKSTYCSEKIRDASFKFYGCSICDISFSALHELDQHVTVHKNRMTSYRLRLRNQFKKKQTLKEKRRLKKLIKIKKEKEEIEIKPEDGYIGNEKTADFVNHEMNSESNGTIDSGNLPVDMNCQINCNANPITEPPTSITESSIKANENHDIKNNVTNNDNENNVTNSNEDVNNGNDSNSKENKMEDAELNNLEKIYKCFACKKQFTLSYYLKLHVRSHTDEKPYTCSVCGQSFITASKLGRHNKRIHLAERYQCRVCFKIYSRFELLTAHFDKTHPEDKLEGEPYDYNAILPYLKELEEQLRSSEDSKPKVDDLFWEEQVGAHVNTPAPQHAHQAIKEEIQEDDAKDLLPKLDITIEEVKVDFDLKVKQEVEDPDALDAGDNGDNADNLTIAEGGDHVGDGDHGDDDDDDDRGVKEENSGTDEEYFPSNTWAALPAAPPARGRGRRGGSRTCAVCSKSVSSASYMRVHMRTHTGEKPFKCFKCGRGFITSSKMHRHVLTHSQDVKSEEDEPKLEIDLSPTDGNEDHKPKKKKTKKKITKKKTKLLKIKKEEATPRKKHQKRPHACEYCNQRFLHLHMLEVHKKSHEGEALVLRCHYCLQEVAYVAALREHEATHTGPKPYLCTICGRTYKKRETMVYHRKRHSPDAEWVCEVCSKRFGAACKLHKHMRTHRADKFVLRYECPVCAHMFNTKYHVHMHLNTHQKEGLILEENRNEILAMVLQNARKIPKQADAPANLTDVIPSDERSRVCNICGQVFHHFYYLEEHLKSHGSRIAIEDIDQAEQKKYICPICNKGFKLHYYLKLHSFTHSKEKPFTCQQCGKGFITKGKLKRHLETHTGLKKYQCHICYKFFTRPSYLRIHIRTIHGTQDYNFRFDKGYGVGSLALSAVSVSDVTQSTI